MSRTESLLERLRGQIESVQGAHGWTLIAAATVLVGIAVRGTHLFWSPLPATLDGFVYVGAASTLLETGSFSLPIAWDSIGFTAILGATSAAIGVDPLYLVQPLTAIIGGVSCLVAVVLVRRIGTRIGWRQRDTALAAIIAGMGLAFDGLYVRRTGVPDEEVVTLLFVPVLALLVNRALTDTSWRATGLAVLVGVSLFPLHSFSTLIAALTVTAIVLAVVHARPDRQRLAIASVLLGTVWLGLYGYYRLAIVVPGLELVYVDRILDDPGLFLAWIIVMGIGVIWLSTSTHTILRGVSLVVLLGQFGLLAVNVVRPVFPGTQSTILPVFLLALPLVLIATLAGLTLPSTASRGHEGAVAAATIAGAVTMVLYALSAGLTPEFFGTVLRAQTFEHVGVLVLGGIGTIVVARRLSGRFRSTRAARFTHGVVAVLVVLTVIASVPLGFMTLDTGEIPTTTTEAEFEATEAAVELIPGRWASDDPFNRLANFHGGAASIGPIRAWVRQGVPPRCPTLYRPSWVSHGVNLFPAPAGRIPQTAFDRWQRLNDHPYTADGVDDAGIVVPPNGSGQC